MFDIKNRRDDGIEVGHNSMGDLATWFYNNHGQKQTNNGKFRCDGNVVYSYNIAIGRLHQNDNGVLMLITTVRYSTTTIKHVNALVFACDEFNMVRVPNTSPKTKEDHVINLSCLLQEVTNVAIKYNAVEDQKSSLPNSVAKLTYYQEITMGIQSIIHYAEHFDVRESKQVKVAVDAMVDIKKFIQGVSNE